jgi:hypothetical protein
MIATILAHPWIDAGAVVAFFLLCATMTALVVFGKWQAIDR